jgi:hypothetical protein
MTSLVLGPMLRHVDETSAAIWVETEADSEVTVTAGDRSWTTRTWAVHGHHYALVECTDLEPGSITPYAVEVGGERVWPEDPDGLGLPPPVIPTLKPGKPLRLAFGSCRTSVEHDEEGNRTHGVDALRAYALAMARVTTPDGAFDEDLRWPDMVLFLGDQVYADETTRAMEEFIASRRDIEEPPWSELKDFQEYAELYRLAWSDPVTRWLLSTLPSAMIFDDHDVRDDWNTSAQWRREMEATSWWHERIVSGLGSYWVYQHLGNLTPHERVEDPMWQLIAKHDGEGELDLTEDLDAFADRADQDPLSYRWSYARDIAGDRLVVLDSRAARVLEEDQRSMIDDAELEWLDAQLQGDVDHLFIGTSLPFLLPEGLQNLEAFNEAIAGGAWGRRGRAAGEWIRQVVDLEHWGAFQEGFHQVSAMVKNVAVGGRGRAPRTITFLSGDVHHSYVSRVRGPRDASVVLQVVCSPIRNPLKRRWRFATAALSYGVAGPLGMVMARSAHVPDPPFRWKRVRGPWFDNNLATLEVTDDGLHMWWATGEVRDGRHDLPVLKGVETVDIEATAPSGEV